MLLNCFLNASLLDQRLGLRPPIRSRRAFRSRSVWSVSGFMTMRRRNAPRFSGLTRRPLDRLHLLSYILNFFFQRFGLEVSERTRPTVPKDCLIGITLDSA